MLTCVIVALHSAGLLLPFRALLDAVLSPLRWFSVRPADSGASTSRPCPCRRLGWPSVLPPDPRFTSSLVLGGFPAACLGLHSAGPAHAARRSISRLRRGWALAAVRGGRLATNHTRDQTQLEPNQPTAIGTGCRPATKQTRVKRGAYPQLRGFLGTNDALRVSRARRRGSGRGSRGRFLLWHGSGTAGRGNCGSSLHLSRSSNNPTQEPAKFRGCPPRRGLLLVLVHA